MACHCFSWATGQPGCLGRKNTVEDCRVACRLAGLGALCYDPVGDCNGDACSSRGTGWWQLVRITITLDCPNIFGPQYPQCEIHSVVEVIAVVATCSVSQPHGVYEFERLVNVQTICQGSPQPCTMRTVYVGDGHWHRDDLEVPPADAILSNSYRYLNCTPTGTILRTPCCFDSGTVRCKFITPAECIDKCGQPFEGTISWSNPTNPCNQSGTGGTSGYPCNLRACCAQPYPEGFPPLGGEDIGNALRYANWKSVV